MLYIITDQGFQAAPTFLTRVRPHIRRPPFYAQQRKSLGRAISDAPTYTAHNQGELLLPKEHKIYDRASLV